MDKHIRIPHCRRESQMGNMAEENWLPSYRYRKKLTPGEEKGEKMKSRKEEVWVQCAQKMGWKEKQPGEKPRRT